MVRWCCRGKLLLPGRPTNFTFSMSLWQGPTAPAVGAGGGCLDIFFSPLSFLSSFSLSGRRPDID